MHREAASALSADPELEPHVEAHGPLELDPADDPFRRLVVSLIRQQVSMEAASAIRERLFERVDPEPASILAADPATLREAGLSSAKAEYLEHAARAFEDNDYDRDYFANLSDDEVSEELERIRGVGPWTANMFLMFALGRPDVFPVEDLGIRNGMQELLDSELSRSEMRTRAERWSPYRSFASLYLWRACDE